LQKETHRSAHSPTWERFYKTKDVGYMCIQYACFRKAAHNDHLHFDPNQLESLVWRYTPIIPAVKRLR
jgi:hypothetical protein